MLNNVILTVMITLRRRIFTGVKKTIISAPYSLLLLSLILASASFASWIYVDRQCRDCQSLDTIYFNFWQKYESSQKVVFGEANYTLPTDTHGDSKGETKLPIIELTISKNNERKLRDTMPAWNGRNQSLPNFKWPLVKAQLSYESKFYPTKVRYRGWFYDHYRLPQKQSWRVQFRKNSLFNGMREINIVNQRPRSIVSDVFQYEIIRRQGFLSPQQKLVHFRKNGKYIGVQTFLEQPSNHFLTRNNMPISQIYGERNYLGDWDTFTNKNYWSIYSGDKKDYGPFWRLASAIKLKGTSEFKRSINKILDVEQYLSYIANAAITLRYNPSSHNNRLYFDPKKGKFQILPWYQTNEVQSFSSDPYKKRGMWWIQNDIAHGLFLVPQFFEEFQRKVWNLINSTFHPQALEDLYDQVIRASKVDIIADAYQHDYGKYGYVSNAEWRRYTSNYRESFSSVDSYIRSELAKSDLRWNWVPEDVRSVGISRRLGIVQFNTDSKVAPRLETVCFSFKKPIPDSAQITLHSTSEDNLPSANWSKQGRRSCFVLHHIVRAKLTARKQQKKMLNPGVLLVGYPFSSIVIMDGEKKKYEYELRLTDLNKIFETDNLPEVDKVEVTAVNSITGAPIDKPVDEVIADSLVKPLASGHFYKFSPAIDDHARFQSSPGIKRWYLPNGDYATSRALVWRKGETVRISEDTILDNSVQVVIEPGVEILLSSGKSLVIEGALMAKGTEEEPIVFRSVSAEEPFGVLAITNTLNRKNHLRHVKISNGSNARILDVSYLGALSIYNADALLENITFEGNYTGDAINSVYSQTKIINSTFLNNADCIDFDFSGGEILNNTFDNCSDDAIDISHSDTLIDGNIIHNAGDKGISIGEKSQPVVSNNIIDNSKIGIAIKDLSTPKILNNRIINSDVGIALYIKKPEFGPPIAKLDSNTFEENTKNIALDDGTLIYISEN